MNKTEQLIAYIADNYQSLIRALDIMHTGKLDSRDIIHSLIVNLHKTDHNFNSIGAYVHGCAKNVCRNMLRHRKCTSEMFTPWDHISLPNIEEPVYLPYLNTSELNMTCEVDVNYTITSRLLRSRLYKAKLTDNHHKILRSYLIDEMSFAQISVKMGSSETNIKHHYRYAINKLREAVQYET